MEKMKVDMFSSCYFTFGLLWALLDNRVKRDKKADLRCLFWPVVAQFFLTFMLEKCSNLAKFFILLGFDA